MTDSLTPERRSWNMGRIRGKDTKPEILVRKVLHRLGYRFRLHQRQLPGAPDIVLPKHRTAIFVHGCFWHRHPGCPFSYMPKSRVAFWEEKFRGNVARDQKNQSLLRDAGWNVITVWECETSDADQLAGNLNRLIKRMINYPPLEEESGSRAAESSSRYATRERKPQR